MRVIPGECCDRECLERGADECGTPIVLPPCAPGHVHAVEDGVCRWCGKKAIGQGFAPADPDWGGPKPATHLWEGPLKGKQIRHWDSFHDENTDWCVCFDEDVACGWSVCSVEGEMRTLSQFLREADWSRTFRIAHRP